MYLTFGEKNITEEGLEFYLVKIFYIGINKIVCKVVDCQQMTSHYLYSEGERNLILQKVLIKLFDSALPQFRS